MIPPGVAPDFAEFYEAEATRSMGLARLLTSPDEASDIVQDAFVGLFRVWDNTVNPSSYLRRSIVNGANNSYRRRSSDADRVQAVRHHASNTAGPPEYLDDLIAQLNPKQRAVVVLRYYLQLRDTEIAETLGMAPGSVGPTLARALKQLRKGLSDDA